MVKTVADAVIILALVAIVFYGIADFIRTIIRPHRQKGRKNGTETVSLLRGRGKDAHHAGREALRDVFQHGLHGEAADQADGDGGGGNRGVEHEKAPEEEEVTVDAREMTRLCDMLDDAGIVKEGNEMASLDGTELYYTKDEPAGLKLKMTEHVIIIATQGWIFEGRMARPYELTDANVVRKWSNGMGIGGLQLASHKDDYTLDALPGGIKLNESAVIAVLPITEW